PVMFMESMSLYNLRGEVPDEDYTTPLGRAAIRRQGADLTIVGVSRHAILAQAAARTLEEEDVDAEVIDLRSVRPVDWETITASVKRTGRCVVVEEGWPTYGVSAEIAAGVQQRAFDYLDAPVLRLGGAEVPMPYSREMERAAIPSERDIVALALTAVGKEGAALADA
ncbi:MAG: transketolase C-terminal domain-containing protein, partial [Candidatus Dormibacterales bacterium]